MTIDQQDALIGIAIKRVADPEAENALLRSTLDSLLGLIEPSDGGNGDPLAGPQKGPEN